MELDGPLDSPARRFERPDVSVMFDRTTDDVSAIQELWASFERVVGLRGRKMYGLTDSEHLGYVTCTPILEGDDPAALGLDVGLLPGGTYLRARIVGEPPGLYERIGPGMKALADLAPADRSRPEVEFYRRRDQIELWLPIASDMTPVGPASSK